ncbi:hypothetical protein [Flavobacterium sp. YO12]|uniref:hypothetical protein n=1 Tax=Flavobacterium sp. YO12 TaxID=1920029 RepID=UPI00100B976C|nr:hypothetical protein [Flavobacterium sp. YO12]RXM49381.1 hypothetical protein BOW55_00895 [Flavobacterium sp. YO12]
MLKNILNQKDTFLLSAAEQKNIKGGGPINPPSNCRCSCPGTGSNSCFSYCPDGTIPALNEGSTGNCKFPFE